VEIRAQLLPASRGFGLLGRNAAERAQKICVASASNDPEEVKQLGYELGRFVFGE
jgi:hypothetical protein